MPAPGDVILVDFPGVQGYKPRPSVVVSSDLYHTTRPDVTVGLCTTQLRSATGPTDYVLQDWSAAGLHVPTAYRCFFASVPVAEVLAFIGRLTDRDWAEVQARLRLAIAVA
ncbi:MAG: type II toxin-antitoxin system PemK/MazF family toxin [Gemmataceae bacterium]|nr:type II toxin-antitoxin system PemK/MazF family toxin [Gemmataceae bacterium]